ncbi:SprT-like family-domain-containing protein [Russula vinacea]|nr:SprT-like family-domain-containing protein [Russula vinacea]
MTSIIEISGSEEDSDVPSKSKPRRRSASLSAIPFASRRSCSIKSCSSDGRDVESEVDRPDYRPRKPGLERARVHRILYSSSDSEEEQPLPAAPRHSNVDLGIIEITDSSDDEDLRRRKPPLPACIGVASPLSTPGQRRDRSDDDDGLLVLNDPKSARRPLRRPQTHRIATASPGPGPGPDRDRAPAGSTDKDTRSLVKAFSTLSSLTTLTDFDSEKKTHVADDVDVDADRPVPTPLPAHAAVKETTPKTPIKATPKSTPAKTPRTSKKALALAEQGERATYAQSLFEELNRSVFAGGLPVETTLIWSNRLLTTAGRARWHRSKEGVHTTSIELATKILDCKERIRNTLSHEMCHLACWIINQDPKEGHGKIWKSWAAKVMRKRPDIDISTRHNYEISYPYEWECESCAKTYGRFSKSIRPDEVVCGACKTGTLHPLFTVRSKRSSKMTANGQMAATSPRDSPRTVVPVRTGMRMPGSFGCGDDDEVNELIQGIRELGVMDN